MNAEGGSRTAMDTLGLLNMTKDFSYLARDIHLKHQTCQITTTGSANNGRHYRVYMYKRMRLECFTKKEKNIHGIINRPCVAVKLGP